jgi:integrase
LIAYDALSICCVILQRCAIDFVELPVERCKFWTAANGSFVRLKASLAIEARAKRRVPYSLRHTYATMRIWEGVNVFQLATNVGTSVGMLDDFYGKKRMRDPKMATEVTKRA